MSAEGGLAVWAERSGRRRASSLVGQSPGSKGRLRFVFYGRVSTEDWQDPVASRARQRAQAEALVSGHGQIVADLFDLGKSRTVAWARRPQAAALVAQLADPGRGWGRGRGRGEIWQAFYGSQYAAMAPLFEHYGVQLWMPEVGGRVDYRSEHDEKTMTVLGLSSRREVARTSIRVRTAMAVQTREQGRYLSSSPPYGYRLTDAGPHPNKAHAAWGRRAGGSSRTSPRIRRWSARMISSPRRTSTRPANRSRRPRTVLRQYLLAGLLACGVCGRRMESAWSNGRSAYRCRHRRAERDDTGPCPPQEHLRPRGQTASAPARPAPPAHQLPSCGPGGAPAPVPTSGSTASPGKVIAYLREHEITITWNPAAAALQARATETAKTVTVKAS